MPAKILNFDDTADYDNIDFAEEKEISIEEMNIYDYLALYFIAFFDPELKANISRQNISTVKYTMFGESWFQSNLDPNFYTFEQIEKMILHMKCDLRKYSDEGQDFISRFIDYLTNMIKYSKENSYEVEKYSEDRILKNCESLPELIKPNEFTEELIKQKNKQELRRNNTKC